MTLVAEAPDIQTTIVECIDSALRELGHSVGEVVFFHIEQNFGISKEEIPAQPEAFSQALHSIFGQGANVLERLVVQKIQERFKSRLKPETSLVEAIQEIKKLTSRFHYASG